MRLGLIYHQFVPRGGLEGYLVEFSKRLVAAGHELDIATAEVSPQIEKLIPAEWHVLQTLRKPSVARLWQFNRLAAHWEQEAPVDVTLGFGRTTCHDLHRAGGGCHAVYSRLLPTLKRWALKNQLELGLERQLYAGSDTQLFVVNSSEIAKQIQAEYGTAADRFRVIHTAVDTEQYRPADDPGLLRKQVCGPLKTDPARPVFLFVSLHHRRKGLDVLLDVWKDVDADLWIVGQPLNYRYRLMIAQRQLQDKIRTISHQSDLRLLFQSADWFIHPTLYDACANTVLQSMASGLPGLISVHDGAIDHVTEGENGYLLKQPRDSEAVFETIQKALTTHRDKRLAMGTAARQRMEALTWPAHLEKWQSAIEDLDPTK